MSGAAEDAGEPGGLQPLQRMCVEVGVDSDSVTLTTTDRAARERQAASQKKQTARLGNDCLLLNTATATATFIAQAGADGTRISIASHEVGDEVALRVAAGKFQKAFRRQARCKDMKLQFDILRVAATLAHVADEHVLEVPESVELIRPGGPV